MIRQGRILLTLMLTAAATLAGSLAYAVLNAPERPAHEDEPCDRLAAVASDPQRVRYVREWVAARMQDERFMAAAREDPYFDRRDPTMWRYIDLDPRRLGFDPTLVQFNDGFGRDVRANGLTYVQIFLGRPSIIIETSAAADVGSKWSEKSREVLKAYGNGVFVLCKLD